MNNNLQLAIKASIKAGEAIMQVYETSFDVEIKEDKSPLTEADKNANDVINSFLKETKIPIISEENKQTNFSVRKNWDTCWVVDPLDGTKEFIKRNGEFTVNIALIKKGKPEIGVIYVPTTRTLYYAMVSEKRGFKIALDIQNTEVDKIFEYSKELKPKPSNRETIKVVGSRSHMNEETLSFVENLKKQGKKIEIVSKGSSLKFCLVAEGNADLYPRFAPTMEWDTAAGQAICEAVGVEVISQKTEEPLLYNKENLLNPWFLVAKK